MPDTPRETSSFRHTGDALALVTLAAVVIGVILRVLAVDGDLWLDELWSLVQVSEVNSPVEIVTRLKHDNNHLLNSLWMWTVGNQAPAFVYRLPSLIFSIVALLLILGETRRCSDRALYRLWLVLLALSYPLTIYGTEARGYALVVLMAIVGFLSLTHMIRDPRDSRAIASFCIAGVVGCLSHAIYALFLAPAVAFLGYMLLTSNLRANSARIVRLGILLPVITACILTVTFYKGMVIGGAPLLPYLEVAASTISVSFGGEALSSVDPSVTGWSLFLCLLVVAASGFELVTWVRSRDPIALLVALIIITPWVAVAVVQPHFILARYFIIQVVFAYLLFAHFIQRLARQGRLGTLLSILITVGIATGNVLDSLQLATFKRSRFDEIFALLSEASIGLPATVGGDQDYQNSLRLRYASVHGAQAPSFTYITDYRARPEAPRFIIRESLDAYEVFPPTWEAPSGARYQLRGTYKAPPLNGSNVYLYEMAR